MTNVYVFRSLLFHYVVNIKENTMYIFFISWEHSPTPWIICCCLVKTIFGIGFQ